MLTIDGVSEEELPLHKVEIIMRSITRTRRSSGSRKPSTCAMSALGLRSRRVIRERIKGKKLVAFLAVMPLQAREFCADA